MKNFELLRYLKKWWFLIMVVTAAGCLLVYQFVSSNQQYTATAVIQYTNVNASAGLNADGTELDPSEITSAAVINRTIEDLGLTSSTESIRSRVSVQEVIPEDEETRKETEMRYRQLPGESVPVVEDAGLCRRTAAALARQGIAPDDGGVYRLTPRQMETLYIQAPELALIHMGSVFLLDSMG